MKTIGTLIKEGTSQDEFNRLLDGIKAPANARSIKCEKVDCFGNTVGTLNKIPTRVCNCLSGKKIEGDCPFYKTKKQWLEEEIETRERILKEKRSDKSNIYFKCSLHQLALSVASLKVELAGIE